MILTKTNGRVQCLRMMQADSDEMFVSVHVAEASRLGSNLYVCFCTSCQLLYAFYLLLINYIVHIYKCSMPLTYTIKTYITVIYSEEVSHIFWKSRIDAG